MGPKQILTDVVQEREPEGQPSRWCAREFEDELPLDRFINQQTKSQKILDISSVESGSSSKNPERGEVKSSLKLSLFKCFFTELAISTGHGVTETEDQEPERQDALDHIGHGQSLQWTHMR